MHALAKSSKSIAKSNQNQNQNQNKSDQSTADAQSATLTDNRPSALAQMKIADGIGNGPGAKKIAQLQTMMAGNATIQRAADEEEVQMKATPIQKKENNTGLPDNLKSGVEKLSGKSLDDVKVHTNSDQPAQMQAHAFAQGTDIHVSPGQEQHLAHEAWHAVQQKQGRVKPTTQMKGDIPINDDKNLENEANVMGAKALKLGNRNQSATQLKELNSSKTDLPSPNLNNNPIQRIIETTSKETVVNGDGKEVKNKRSFEIEIPKAFKASIEYDEEKNSGKVEIGDAKDSTAFKGFAGSGTIEKNDKGNWQGKLNVSLPKTPKVETPDLPIPIPPIPAGIPGIWVQLALEVKA